MTDPQPLQRLAYAFDGATTHVGYDWWVRKVPHLAPERVGNHVTALVDGKETMAAIAEDIKKAKEYIYITDWALMPTVRLIRNGALKTAIYHARKSESVLDIAHKYHTSVGEILRLNPNMKLKSTVSPADFLISPFYGAGKVLRSVLTPRELETVKLATDQALTVPDDKNTLLYLLWERASNNVQIRIIVWDSTFTGQSNKDFDAELILQSTHKNIRVSRNVPNPLKLVWSHHQKSVIVDGKVSYLGGIDLCGGRWDDASHSLRATPDLHEGDDFYNPGLTNKDDPKFVSNLDYNRHPRMPWHDVHLRIEGPSVYDVEKSFVERWNFQCTAPELSGNIPALIRARTVARKFTEQLLEINEVNALTAKVSKENTQKVQIVRSVSGNHILTKETECSIYNAYANAIRGAQHYIYIENQFFISDHGDNSVSNRIADLLAARVVSAIAHDELFKIVLLIPAHPEGSVFDWHTYGIMHYQFRTIGRPPSNANDEHGGALAHQVIATTGLVTRIIDTLKKHNKPEEDLWAILEKYIGIYCLRNHGVLDNKPVHEQIYVHTKLMIVDDRIAIVGSANLNDRSLLGNLDSELSAIVEDQRKEKITIDGAPVYVRTFAHQLRRRLWAEHLGVREDDPGLMDPYEGFKQLKARAEANTKIYESVFEDVPSDRIQTLKQLKAVLGRYDMGRGGELSGVKGHIVKYPLQWLYGQKMDEWYLPATPFVENDIPATPGPEGETLNA